MQDYDVTLDIGQARSINVQADYIYYRAGSAGGADAAIEFSPQAGGESVFLYPGQSYRVPRTARGLGSVWTLRNRKGEGKIVGSVLMGEGSFQDNRISGAVEVIDGGRNRTIAGQAYMGAVAALAVAANYSHVQLWNPPGTGKNLVVEAVMAASSAAALIDFGPQSVMLSNLFGAPRSKRFATGAVATVAEARYQQGVALMLGNSFANVMVPASQTMQVVFHEPIVIAPGWGLMVQSEQVNTLLTATFEYFEESTQ